MSEPSPWFLECGEIHIDDAVALFDVLVSCALYLLKMKWNGHGTSFGNMLAIQSLQQAFCITFMSILLKMIYHLHTKFWLCGFTGFPFHAPELVFQEIYEWMVRVQHLNKMCCFMFQRYLTKVDVLQCNPTSYCNHILYNLVLCNLCGWDLLTTLCTDWDRYLW